jgi:hypothetical protein
MIRHPVRIVPWLAVAIASALPGCSCSSSDDTANPPPASGSDAGADGEADALGDSNQPDVVWETGPPESGGCHTGDPCGDGGVCAGETCCDRAQACADVCCATGMVCSFQQCVTPGSSCYDSTDCAPDEYCEYSIGDNADAGVSDAGGGDASDPDAGPCTGGTKLLQGKCLPRPPTCDGDAGTQDGGPITCLETCQYVPPATGFEAHVTYTWGGEVTPPYSTDVMMTPIVMQLDDDDCDGKITVNDIPEIIFNTFSATTGGYTNVGTIHAIAIVDGQVVEKWSVPGRVAAASELAAGNIDGQPGNEVVACVQGGGVVAFAGDSTELWATASPIACRIPAIADLGGQGHPAVIVEGGIVDGATGDVLVPFATSRATVAADFNGDGVLELVSGAGAWAADGTMLVDTGLASSWPAVGDFDNDGVPEIVAVDYQGHRMALWHYDAAEPGKFKIVRSWVDINGSLDPALCPTGSSGNTHGGGPPTVADFNGDGYPDVALAGGVGYAVLDGRKLMDPSIAGPDTFLWVKQTHDCSSAATGSSIFDFNGDGRAEVVYSDEFFLRIYDGETGDVLFETCNTTGTLIEYPVIADVNSDGRADIVVASNAYAYSCNGTKQSGIRIFESTTDTWVRTRRVWNQHAYHITNVEEDGTIPAHETPNWTVPGLNNFRQNKQPGSEFAAPDAVVSVAVPCGAHAITATVRNVGEAALPAGLLVTFWSGAPQTGTILGQASTIAPLYSVQSELVTIALDNPAPDVANGATPIYAEVHVPASVHECRPDNNQSPPAYATCDGPK